MRRMMLLVGAVAVVAVAVFAAGCGGGGSDSSTDDTPPPATTEARAATRSASAQWVMTDLGSLGSGYSRATAINDVGQVVGTSRAATGERHVFLWEKGRMTDLGLYGGNPDDDYRVPGPLINERGQVVWVWPRRGVVIWTNGVVRSLETGRTYAQVYAINDRGQVVGSADTKAKSKGGSPHLRAFLWQNGRMTDLGPDFYDGASFDMDINERGQIVGLLDHRQATVWENGKLRRLGTLGGKESNAVAINDRGQVTGCADTNAKDPLGYPIDHAFLWQNGKMTDLGVDCNAWPLAINNRGDVIFFGVAEFWRNGRRVKLGTLGGTYGNAEAINDVGQVVGDTVAKFGSRTQWHAFVSENGVMTDLGTLDGGNTSRAVAINNKGQIVGTAPPPQPLVGAGHGEHAVLWTLRNG